MTIEIVCEKCQHKYSVPRSAAGQQSKCPRCQNSVYIPTPVDELEELPLAPEEPTDHRSQAQLDEERRQVERMLTHEDLPDESPASRWPRPTSVPPFGSSLRSSPEAPPPGSGRTTVKAVVLAYLSAMRDSDLKRAEQAFALLANHRDAAIRMIDRLAADQIPPTEVANLPSAVYQGFLKSLRSRL